MTQASDRRIAGSGCAKFLGLVVTVLLVVVLVGVFIVNDDDKDEKSERVPVPDDVPPAVADSVDDLQATAEAISMPADFLAGYIDGAETAADEFPNCHIGWNTLAGIGFVETHHGTYGVEDSGDPIVGPRLDGSEGFMEVPDTDNGEIDGDTEYDRAVGPMQFLPDSWRLYGADGDPHNIADSAAASARLLCNSHDSARDMSTPEGWSEALFSYNRSEQYMTDVRDAAANYALGQSAQG